MSVALDRSLSVVCNHHNIVFDEVTPNDLHCRPRYKQKAMTRLSSRSWPRGYIYRRDTLVKPVRNDRRRTRKIENGFPNYPRLQRLEFFLLRSPLDGAGSVLTFRARCSVAELHGPAGLVFSTSGFHCVRNEACQFRNQRWRQLPPASSCEHRFPRSCTT
jgi:hypothetical protein